jgi:hypothetical protein
VLIPRSELDRFIRRDHQGRAANIKRCQPPVRTTALSNGATANE